uniref:lysozyme n=1 Tax=Heterorhabditis bacteriophora TaxID=37862 RepID=A0A1I7XRE8_HETBA
MITKLFFVLVISSIATADNCLHCICLKETGCKPVGCHKDVGSQSCGYYQIKLPYYKDCGTPGRKSGEDITTAWHRCADDYNCATQCVKAYINRYKSHCAITGENTCQTMSRIHNGGPNGCKNPNTLGYWQAVKKCCGCS